MNRRIFIRNSTLSLAAASASPVLSGDTKKALSALSDRLPSPQIGPYPLMWQSEDQAPYIEEIGLGIATLKVQANSHTSRPIWPAVRVLAKEHDPIRSLWEPHGHSPIEPNLLPTRSLRLVERNWRPHAIESEFALDSAIIKQTLIALPGGAMSELDFGEPYEGFFLDGESHGEAGVEVRADGLLVNELHPSMRPLEYRIRLSPAPDRVELDETGESKEAPADSSKRRWRFRWKRLRKLRLSVKINGASGMPAHRAVRRPAEFAQALEDRRESWARYYDSSVLRVQSPDERINRFIDFQGWVYRSNGLFLGGLLNHRFGMPKQTFWAFWCWDCCFNAVAGRWYHDRELVWGNLMNMPNVQLPGPSRVAGCITNSAHYFGPKVFLGDDPMAKRANVMPHALDSLPLTPGDGSHPPVLCQAIHALWKTEGERRLPLALLETAQRYHDWIERRRQSERHPGLLLVRRWSDSGMDNSKRWGRQGSGIYNTELEIREWSMPIITVDLNVYSVLEKRALAEMWRHSGEERNAKKLLAEADRRAELTRKILWNDKAQFYMDLAESNNYSIPVYSPTGAYPLLLDELPAEHEDAIFDKLLDPNHFFTPAPFPSLSVSDPDFRASKSYWMGPSWMSYTAYIVRGMFRRRPEDAWKVMDNLLDTFVLDGVPQIFENYNPHTREGYDCHGFHWQGLFLDLILTEVIGLRTKGDTLAVSDPKVPEDWSRLSVSNLYFNGKTYDLMLDKIGEKWVSRLVEKHKTKN